MSVQSPSSNRRDLASVNVLLNGSPIEASYQITDIECTHAINRIPVAHISLLDGSASQGTFEISESNNFKPGSVITIKAGYKGNNETIFVGTIVRQRIRVDDSSGSQLQLTCMDEAVRSTVVRSSEQFLRKKDSDVINLLLQNHGLAAEVTKTEVEHEQLLKHRATDWDFIISRAEVNGHVVIVSQGKVTVGPPKFEPPELIVTYGDTLTGVDVELDVIDQLSSVVAKSWDSANQKVVSQSSSEPLTNHQGNLTGQQLAAVMGEDEFELSTFGSVAEAELGSWANAQLQKSRLARFKGSVTFPGNNKANVGNTLQLDGLGKRFSGHAYVAGVTHKLSAGEWQTRAEFGLDRKWFSETSLDTSSVVTTNIHPGITGLHIATVKKIYEDPLGERRVQVVFPLVSDNAEGVWVRTTAPYATRGAGVCFLPEIGDEVIVGFLDGDFNAGVILGSLHSSANPAPLVADELNTMKGIVSKNQLTISFDDINKNLNIETPGGHHVILSDEDTSITIADANENIVVMNRDGITLTSTGDISLDAQGKLSISAQEGVDISTPANLTAKAMDVTVQADSSLTATGSINAEVSSSGHTVVKGAMVMIN